MKNVFILAAAAALVLSSCSNDEIVKAPETQDDGAVVFGAYAGRNTRAAITNVADLATAGGFGVYAYEQGTVIWNTYSASNSVPNFMYNQQVKGSTGTNGGYEWTYAPVKYYSNIPGAYHSFFAYAPYSKDVKTVFALGKAPAIRFSAGETTDLMFADATIDKGKAAINGKVVFNFKHGLSQVAFDVAPFVDKVHQEGGPQTNHPIENPLADNTTITLRSIKFIGRVPSQGLMSLKDGSWTVESMEEGAYQIIPSTVISLDKSTTDYVPVASGLMVIPTQSTDKVKIQVIYDVVTVDPYDARNNSTVTNVITSDSEYPLVAGTSYLFHLDLGLTSVKFEATVADWTAPEEHWADLPNNQQ